MLLGGFHEIGYALYDSTCPLFLTVHVNTDAHTTFQITRLKRQEF